MANQPAIRVMEDDNVNQAFMPADYLTQRKFYLPHEFVGKDETVGTPIRSSCAIAVFIDVSAAIDYAKLAEGLQPEKDAGFYCGFLYHRRNRPVAFVDVLASLNGPEGLQKAACLSGPRSGANSRRWHMFAFWQRAPSSVRIGGTPPPFIKLFYSIAGTSTSASSRAAHDQADPTDFFSGVQFVRSSIEQDGRGTCMVHVPVPSSLPHSAPSADLSKNPPNAAAVRRALEKVPTDDCGITVILRGPVSQDSSITEDTGLVRLVMSPRESAKVSLVAVTATATGDDALVAPSIFFTDVGEQRVLTVYVLAVALPPKSVPSSSGKGSISGGKGGRLQKKTPQHGLFAYIDSFRYHAHRTAAWPKEESKNTVLLFGPMGELSSSLTVASGPRRRRARKAVSVVNKSRGAKRRRAASIWDSSVASELKAEQELLMASGDTFEPSEDEDSGSGASGEEQANGHDEEEEEEEEEAEEDAQEGDEEEEEEEQEGEEEEGEDEEEEGEEEGEEEEEEEEEDE